MTRTIRWTMFGILALGLSLAGCDKAKEMIGQKAPPPTAAPQVAPAPAPAPVVAPAPAPVPPPKSIADFSKAYAEVQCALANNPDPAKADDVRLQVLSQYKYDLKSFVEDKARYGTAEGEKMKALCLVEAKKDKPAEKPAVPVMAGTFKGGFNMGSGNGDLTITIRGKEASGSLSMGRSFYKLSGTFTPPNAVGLHGTSGPDFVKIAAKVRGDGKSLAGSVEGSTARKPFRGSFSIQKR